MKFPHPETSDPYGLVFVGGQLSLDSLLSAYSLGIFPWPEKDLPILWFCPHQRGILFFDKFQVSHSTQKYLRKAQFKMTINQCFSQVIDLCASTHQNLGKGTWILPEMIGAYKDLHKNGYAHSFEVWKDDAGICL